jgi:uncharacterized membrane protein
MMAVLVWGAAHWLIPAGILAAAVLLGLLWGYYRATTSWVRFVAPLLKLVAVIALIVCLVDPLWHGVRPRPGANLFLVLVDNSQSLTIRDSGSETTRGESLRPRLDPESVWAARLAQDFDVRTYSFDSRLRSLHDTSTLTFDGSISSMGAALRTLAQRFRGRPVAGVLLFTDGNATDDVAAPDLPPVYPVLVGDDRPLRDLRVDHLAVTLSDFRSAPVEIQATIAADDFSGPVVVQLLDEQQQIVEQQAVEVREREPLRVQFRFRPDQPGLTFYQVRAYPRQETPESGQQDRTDHSTEATLANNSRWATIDQGQGPYRVLYVSGRPNWELKFLQRAVERDDEVRMAAIIRIAKREPKFEFLGRSGESSNPLFRGFEKDPEELERYDQPVLLRLGKADELQDGFPRTPENLFPFHGVILDDVEAEFFTADQMALLKKFVTQRGGGLLMLGGAESFRQGIYANTPVGELLPVYVDPGAESRLRTVSESGVRVRLTRDGLLQSWVRLRSTESDERQRLDGLPAFSTLNITGSPKPGAHVVLEVTDAQGNSAPALVVQRFGNGRSASLLLGDLWRWGIRQHDVAGKQDFENQWIQLVRWLVADVPRRVDIRHRRLEQEPGMPVQLEVQVRDEKFEGLDNAQVRIRVTDPDGRILDLPAEPGTQGAGTYAARYVPRAPGVYRATVTATTMEGVELESRETGWVSEPATDEFRILRPDRRLLEGLADRSGGELILPEDLESFVQGLPNRKIPVVEPWIYPLWHRWPIFSLALLCLVGEWGLRRWRGLP